ncbi:GNAT family N-acetyltransferase [Deinococcus multiflagellatus]|uniref:GNAT family N-acetyltransferase n=1 Tax=Deinococcus multiflagellatus TaxID=1656887 RepID=A0ABW1ZQ32_9DEIO|nr:GNAT family N-acetyltransferase [Deinococcus multiflagellatus]MBZ9713896.1 GNAT family N-acetyltransferase [Deinococcus multiflagellatus]
MTAPTIRRLTLADAPAYRAARLAALRADPEAFVTTAEQFAAWPAERLAERLAPDAPGVTLGAFLNGDLVGLLTLMREEPPTQAHRVNIFSVSVAPAARGQGVGEALVRAAMDHAHTWPGVTSLHLTVMDTQHAARRLYERCGFRVWGTQPDAVRRNGRVHEEHWMWLPL